VPREVLTKLQPVVKESQSCREECAVCQETLTRVRLPFPSFRHFDFSTIASESKGWRCDRCDLLQKLDTFSYERDLFSRRSYQLSDQTAHRVGQASGQDQSRSELQAEYLCRRLPEQAGRLLDVGCFNGALLRHIYRERPSLDLVGYDLAPFGTNGDSACQFELTNDREKAFSGRYDAIVFSHSIMYIDDLPELLNKCKTLLSDSGFLYIQLPDIQINPLYALMGDQAFIFQEQNLSRLLAGAGFQSKRHSLEKFGRDLVLTAHHTSVSSVCAQSHPEIQTQKNSFEGIFREIDTLKIDVGLSIENEKVHILGTTIFAAFVHEVMPRNVVGFVDENREKHGSEFRGLPVHHPKSNSAEHRVLVEPTLDGRLEKRLNQLYAGCFFSPRTKS